MSPIAMDWPHSVCAVRATSWTVLLPQSAMYNCWPLPDHRPVGSVRSAAVATTPLPPEPAAPVALPATVYMSNAVNAGVIPHWAPLAAGTSWTRLLPESAMYRSPAVLSVTASGLFNLAEVAALPSPVTPDVPAELPAIVYTSPAVMVWFHWEPPAAATYWIRLLLESGMNRLSFEGPPAGITAIDSGAFSVEPVAAPPSAPSPAWSFTPATVYRSPAVIEIWPHWVPDAAAISTTRLLPVSAMNRFPAWSTVTPAGPNSSELPAGVPSSESP